MIFLSVSNLMFKCMSEIVQCFICMAIIDDFLLHGNSFYVVNDAQWVIPQIETMVLDIAYYYYYYQYHHHRLRHHQTT
jgi:hypothetical protein